MHSKAATVEQYLAALPAERRAALEALRKVILKNLDRGFAEGMQYGMIGYFVPHSRYPAGYHCAPKQPLPMGNLASQKNHLALYLMSLYQDPALLEWFIAAWKKTGKRLDMGKCCVRFQRIEDIPLDVIGKLFRRTTLAKFLRQYEQCLAARPAATKTFARASSSRTRAHESQKTATKTRTPANKKPQTTSRRKPATRH